jgi:hypothetical protein
MSKLIRCASALALTCGAVACGGSVHPAPYTFTGRHIALPPAPREHCPTSAYFSRRDQVCLPRRAGPPTGARSTGSLRLARAPLVELFPPETPLVTDPSFWVYVRLNRNPRQHLDVSINHTLRDDDSARSGYDQRDPGRHCFGFSYIDQRGPVDPSLRHAHVGQKVTVTIQEGNRRASMRVPLRIKNPHDSADAGGQGWFAALGCR